MGNDIFVHRVILKYAYNPSKAYRLICQGNIFVSMFLNYTILQVENLPNQTLRFYWVLWIFAKFFV